MSTQTEKIREAILLFVPQKHTVGEHMQQDALAALSELEAHPSEPRLTVDQLREEMELLGSMIRAERSTATEANRQCTDEQLERCYQLGDRLTKAAQ